MLKRKTKYVSRNDVKQKKTRSLNSNLMLTNYVLKQTNSKKDNKLDQK